MLFEEFAREQLHSPVRTQYLNIKRQNPDAILFFRMGDFYEMFDEDAEIVARELEIALTRRDFGRGEKSPMAGIPHHAADGYISRLVGKGYHVAVCDHHATRYQAQYYNTRLWHKVPKRQRQSWSTSTQRYPEKQVRTIHEERQGCSPKRAAKR